MPDYTTNHGFQLFANGEEQWEHRTDFEQLDTSVPIVDSNANRTHYTPKSSAVYIADDTGDVYIGLGAQWDHIGTIGGSGGGETGTGDVEWRDDGTVIATSAVADLGNNLSVTTGPDGEAVIHAADGSGSGSGSVEWLDNGESRVTSATADLGDNLTVTTGDNGEARIDASSGSGGSSGTAQGGEVVVTEGSELQSALNSNGVVRISGRVDVTNYSPITVPNYRSIFGYGMFERHAHPQEVDIIDDNSSGPTLHVTGNHCKLHGFAIAQRNKSSGVGLKLEGYSPNVSHLDIDGGYIGIQIGDRASSTTHTEPRVQWCKIFPYGGQGSTMPGSGSKGIYVEDMHDAKLIHNIIGGYDIGIELRRNHAYVTGTHIYAYPRSSMSTGIRLGNTGSAEECRYVRVVGNRVEDNVTGRGIQFGDWFGDKYVTNNLLEVHNGATGIERTTSDNTYQNMMIQNNIIRSSGSTPGGTALDIAPRNQHSTIGNNVVDNMTSVGNATIQSNGSPSASNHMPGAMVVDATTGDLYYRSTVGMHQIG